MATIRKDDRGLYAKVGGYIVRPMLDTAFKEGDKVVGHHFRGSTFVGMGKKEGKGQYQEYWRTDWIGEYEVYKKYYGVEVADRFLEQEREQYRIDKDIRERFPRKK